jgi:hypothetical protein
MNITKYINHPDSINGDVISLLVTDLYKENQYKNILFIRTCTTGGWMDKLLLEKSDIHRVLYYTDAIKEPIRPHPSTKIIHSRDVENQLLLLNKTFDLICMDTWHEYDVSSRDFKILSPFLNESGLLISHDCYPWNIQVANPQFIHGSWCGETYIAFVEFAYQNPHLYYTILNVDTGIGIASKKSFYFLSNTLNREKQEQLLLHKDSKDPYPYFIEHSKDIINAISS